ncbi:chromosome partitioning protein ParA [Pseudomonas stutzeri]|nr:chromosome partitioning protein ParA [Stutzerimonas stutzeri]
MSLQKKPQMVEAVMFFNERGICKEMLYPEFEAMLDGVVNLPEFADLQMRAAFVLINPRLLVKAVVCFYIDFGDHGEADRGWNIPLRHLADRTGNGPDLGAGPIRLACRSQCPVSWHQMHLWDPGLSPAQNDLLLIRDAAKRNNLGVLVEDDTAPAVQPAKLHMAPEHKWYMQPDDLELIRGTESARKAERLEQEERLKAAQLLRQQRLRIAGLTKQHEEELARLRLQSGQREQALQQRLGELKQTLAEQMLRNETLKTRLAEQAASFQRSREEMDRQLQALAQHGRSDLEALRRRFEQEAEASIEAALLEHREREQQQEARLASQAAEAARLRGELASLSAERDRLAREGGEQTLERLAAQGVVFVAYHPGVGHLTLPLQDLAGYQRNPLGYVAAKCFVSEAQYRDWLAHYQQPACTAQLPGGGRCSIPIDRVDSPSRFVSGESDCCARHRASVRQRNLGG